MNNEILAMAYPLGFCTARIHYEGGSFFLVCALPYGNIHDDNIDDVHDDNVQGEYGIIAPFVRFNYYKEAVSRLKSISLKLRKKFPRYKKSDFRIFCNSHINEKKLAAAAGVGFYGKNTLIITQEAGSLVVLAAMTLPPLPDLRVTPCPPPSTPFPLCSSCAENPPCASACPTGALDGKGGIDLSLCIQYFLNGRRPVPDFVKSKIEGRLYGCTNCTDVCPHNQKKIEGIKTGLGALPARLNIKELLKMNEYEFKSFFHDTALGLKRLRNAVRSNVERFFN